MKLTPETMADVSTNLLQQNDWGEDAKVQYLGWLTRPGIRAEASVLISVLIEFTSPAVANRVITTGVVRGKQIHNAVRFRGEGWTKLCRKCQKPGHIQSHCSDDYKYGHCADTGADDTSEMCQLRPVSRGCPVKAEAMKEAKQTLVDCRHTRLIASNHWMLGYFPLFPPIIPRVATG